jgi:dynactin 1
MEVKVGQTVQLKEHARAEVRYVGDIHIRPGTWIGAELPTPTGKNDGSIKGERYFECAPQHGVFVPETGVVKILSQPAAARPAATAAAPKPASKSRPSSISSSSTAQKPSSRLSTVGLKPVKRPSAQPSQQPRPASSTAHAPKTTSQPVAAPATTQPRSSASATSKAPAQLATTTKRQSIAAASQPFTSSRVTRKPSFSSTSTAAPARPTASTTTSSSATQKAKDPRVQTLETENAHLKKQNGIIQEQLTAANQAKVERDRFEAIVQKLQAKCQTYHQEHVELKGQIRAKETLLDAAHKEIEFNEANHEMAVLDKETAELKFEQMEAERDALEHQMEVIRLELEIAEEQVAMFNEDLSPEQRSAAASSIVQKENARLRSTIQRMHEDTEDLKRDYTRRISELEKAATDTEALEEEISELREREAAKDSTIEDLLDRVRKQDEWEDIVEDLSDKNQHLQEQAVQKDATIEQYVTLKELADEVEAQLVDRVHELLDEQDAKELELIDCQRQMREDATAREDQGLLIEKLRQFIVDTQHSMSQVETMKTMSDEHVKQMTDRFNEAMEMNRAMRNARVNDLSKTIDIESSRLELGLVHEELDILKHYLPDTNATFTHTSMLAYFRARKIASSASLVRSQLVVVDVVNPQGLDQAISDMDRCETAYQIELIQHSAEFFHANAKRASVEQFRHLASTYDEMSEVEAMLQRTLTCFKQDNLNLQELANTARANAAHMRDHIARSFFEDIGPDCWLLRTASEIRANLDRVQGYFDALRTAFTSAGQREAYEHLTALPDLSKECHAAATKLLQVLIALQNDKLYPVFENGTREFNDVAYQVENLAASTRGVTKGLIRHFSKEGWENYTSDDVIEECKLTMATHYDHDPTAKMKEIRSQLSQWTEFASVLMNTAEVESSMPPWEIKAQELEAKKKAALDSEKKLAILMTEHQAAIIKMNEREEIISTKELEIEHLKAKNKDFFTRNEEMNRLQSEWRTALLELPGLRAKVREQESEISHLKDETQRKSQSYQLSVPEERAVAPAPAPVVNSSSAFTTFVEALSDENHWLRQRENSEMFGHNLDTMFSRMRKAQDPDSKMRSRRRQAQACEMLDMVLKTYDVPETPIRATSLDDTEFMSDSWSPDFKSTPPRPTNQEEALAKDQGEPLLLSTAQASYRADSLFGDNVEDYCFHELSTVADDFEDGTEDLEGFSEILM